LDFYGVVLEISTMQSHVGILTLLEFVELIRMEVDGGVESNYVSYGVSERGMGVVYICCGGFVGNCVDFEINFYR
jgi:hypothetical protein